MDLSVLVNKAGDLLMRYPEIILSATSFVFIYFLRYVIQLSGSAVPVNWPIIGMLPTIVAHAHQAHHHITSLLQLTGGNFLFKGPWFTNMDYFATADPANVNHILSTNFPNYPKGKDFTELFDILGDGILNSDGEIWSSHRKMALSLLSSPRFRTAVSALSTEKAAEAFLPLLGKAAKENSVIDMYDVLMRFSFDLTFMLVLGVDPGCLAFDLPDIPFARAMGDIEHVWFWRHTVPKFWWKLQSRLNIGEERMMTAAREIVDKYILQCINNSKEQESGGGRADLLTSYMEIARKDGSLSEKLLRDTMLSFILAARDSVGSGLAWFFWLVSMHPRVEHKILDELRQLKQQSNQNHEQVFDAEEIDKLVYLHASICESLRLFSPTPFNRKVAIEADVLPSGHRIRPGQNVFISLFTMARMEAVWGKDCAEFRPERWIDPATGRVKHEPSYKFLTFFCGPRSCLGKNMAMTFLKTAAAAVIYNFEVVVEEGHAVEPKLSIILQMKDGLKVRLRKREGIN